MVLSAKGFQEQSPDFVRVDPANAPPTRPDAVAAVPLTGVAGRLLCDRDNPAYPSAHQRRLGGVVLTTILIVVVGFAIVAAVTWAMMRMERNRRQLVER